MVSNNRPLAWSSFIWDTLNKPPRERKFLLKLDAALLTFACLGNFVKRLDSGNVNNAFVSGMKEDLDLYENQLNYMNTSWVVGYILGGIPSNFLLAKFRPSIWLPIVELVWITSTMLLAACRNVNQIYVLRFVIGLAESSFYPATHYLIGSWYRSDELAKRTVLFLISGQIAKILSGWLMAIAYNLNGKNGLPGWRWLFILDGVISFPIAFLGFYLIPDTPDDSRASYLTLDNRELAKTRMKSEGRKLKQPWTKAKAKKILTSWHIYGLVLLQVLFVNGDPGAPIFAQYLKSSTNPKYTVYQINTYPTGASAINIVATLFFGWTSDSILRGKRWPGILFIGMFMPVFYISMAIWNIPERWRWACFYASSIGGGIDALTFSWAHEICLGDTEERILVIVSMNGFANIVQAWLPLLVWQQVDAPRYQKGYITSTVIFFLLIPTALYLRSQQLWERKRAAQHVADTPDSVNSAKQGDKSI